MFNRKKIDELEIRVRRLESDVQWLKNELSGYTYSEPGNATLAYAMGLSPVPMVQKRAVGLIEFRSALLKKLGLKFVEKPASMELEDA